MPRVPSRRRTQAPHNACANCDQCRFQRLVDSIRFLQSDHTFLQWLEANSPDEFDIVRALDPGIRSALRAALANLRMRVGLPPGTHVTIDDIFARALLCVEEHGIV